MRIVCNFCSCIFHEKSKFLEHLKNNHKLKEGQDLLICPAENCGRDYSVFKSLSQHLDKCVYLRTIENDLSELELCFNITANLSLKNDREKNTNDALEGPFLVEENSNHASVNDISTNFYVSETIPSEKRNESNCFVYNIDLSTKNICEFLTKNYARKIDDLSLTNVATNSIYKVTEDLVESLHEFYSESLRVHIGASTEEVLNVATDFVLNKLKTLDTDYKRNKFIEAQPNYVKPDAICIGIKWDKQHDSTDFKQVRPTYSSISIRQTLISLFSRELSERNIFFIQ